MLYQGSRCRGSRCPTLFPKLDIWTPASTVLYTVQYRGSRCRGSRCRGSRCRGSRCRGSRCTPLLPDDEMPNDLLPRKSEDKSTNPYESEFLSLVLNNNLIIVNGRTLRDLSGSFNCIKPNGSSVFDYFMVSKKITINVQLLEVLAFTPYFDHEPLLLTLPPQKLNLSISRPLREIYDAAPSKMIFDDNSLINFIDLKQFRHSNIYIKRKISLLIVHRTRITSNSVLTSM